MIRKILIHITLVLSATGCTSPSVKVDSMPSEKQLSFPQVGVQSVARAGAVAALYVDYRSSRVFQLTQPLNLSVMMVNNIAVTTDEPLFKSDIGGETVYCTASKTYIDRVLGPYAIVCFKSTSSGKFSAATYRPGAIWLSKALSPEVEFVAWESKIQRQGKPLKRELVFEGSRGGVVMFSERIFDKSLDTPSMIKPLITQIPTLPMKASLDGMEMNIVRVDEHTLTFEVTKPWQ